MISIGIAGIPQGAKGGGTEAGIQYLCDIGLDAMEVQFVRNVYMTPKTAKAGAEAAERCGLKLSVHAPYYINLASKKKETQEKSKDWLVRSARIAHVLGAGIVVFHPAREVEPGVIKGHLTEVSKTLSGEGINTVLGLETTGDEVEFGSIDDIMDVIREVPGTDIVLDFAHLHSRGNGALKTKADFEEVFDKLSSVKKNDFHIHFSGIEYKNAREVRHLPIDAGPDFRLLAEVLTERDYNARIICESPELENDALKMKKIIKELNGKSH
ncbi:endonuclease IV [Methanocella sp. CWC-04]|uniref:Endonuclease IV n=1 Tax=Methanooceanicella nereidis TaxID=2052831 RepID=A0AAP2W644_9EURY|nr:TIM barrel protein [Methanocella sp. CWC-04]MCD1294973.1 endonuclease IV [Methanocella sp. CWC-04]